MTGPEPSPELLKRHKAAMTLVRRLPPEDRLILLGYVVGLVPSSELERYERDAVAVPDRDGHDERHTGPVQGDHLPRSLTPSSTRGA